MWWTPIAGTPSAQASERAAVGADQQRPRPGRGRPCRATPPRPFDSPSRARSSVSRTSGSSLRTWSREASSGTTPAVIRMHADLAVERVREQPHGPGRTRPTPVLVARSLHAEARARSPRVFCFANALIRHARICGSPRRPGRLSTGEFYAKRQSPRERTVSSFALPPFQSAPARKAGVPRRSPQARVLRKADPGAQAASAPPRSSAICAACRAT